MDRTAAEQVIHAFFRASSLCSESIELVRFISPAESHGFTRLASAFLGQTYTKVLAPLWRVFPDLKPPESQSTSGSDDHPIDPRTLRSFLDQAHSAILLVTQGIPDHERAQILAFGGLQEIESATAAIESFTRDRLQVTGAAAPPKQ
jgi:hypothetical protein